MGGYSTANSVVSHLRTDVRLKRRNLALELIKTLHLGTAKIGFPHPGAMLNTDRGHIRSSGLLYLFTTTAVAGYGEEAELNTYLA